MAVARMLVGSVLLASSFSAGLASGTLSAQEAEAEATSEIIVEAPRSVPLPAERSPFTGAPTVTSTVRIPVLYDDLDLSQPRDRERLMTRVQRVAEDACRQLDQIYPFDSDTDCGRKAMASGSAAAEAAITRATAGE